MRKVIFMALAIFIVLGVMHLISGQDKSVDELIAESEELWAKNEFDGSDRVLREALKKDKSRAEIYWRMARNEYDRIEGIPREKKPGKNELIKRYRGIEALAAKCIELDPNDGNCWMWKGVGMGRRGTTSGILNSLREAKELEEAFLKAESLNPQYRSADGSANALGDIYNALGQFYRVLPEWLCEYGFKKLFGVCGDLDKSVDYQKKAVAREPERIEYLKELGASLLCRGTTRNHQADLDEGKKYLDQLQSLPEIKPTDKIDKEHARQMIADPSIACGYSRDAQQEQSREALK